MFDYYGLPSDWPGVAEGKRKPFRIGIRVIEESMHQNVFRELGTERDALRFVPYLQLHEFEALLFCGPNELSQVLQDPALESEFRTILDTSSEPEAIDDSPSRAPSKRIESLAPHFQKTFHGAIAAQRIGIDRMRAACPHFASWLAKLQALP